MLICRQNFVTCYRKCLSSVVIRKYSSVATGERILKSSAPKIEDLQRGNLVNTIFKNVDKYWSRTAIECPESELSFTFSEIADQVSRWSGFLKEFGVTPKDTVTIVAPNCIQFAPLFLGTVSLGIPFSPINAKYTPSELKRMLDITQSKFIIYSKDVEENISLTLKEDINKYHLFCIGKSSKLKAHNVEDILYGKQSVYRLQPSEIVGEETCYIPFSSGTTGTPKAVELSHNALSASMLILTNSYHNLTWQPRGQEQNILLGMLPFFHIFGAFGILSYGLLTGAKMIIVPTFSAEAFVTGIPKHKISLLHVVPSLINLLNNTPNSTADSLKSVHTVFVAAAPLLTAYVDAFKEKVQRDIDILEGYGLTETMITHLIPRKYKHALGCGKLMSNSEAKVISSETGETLGPNQTGEICLRTPSIMKGYLNNIKATNEMIRNGWVHTGDIGYYDEKEFFHIIDRTKDLIKYQGLQVSPSEIETEIQKHPLVAECSVIGKADDKYGELPFAFIIPKQEISADEIHKFLEDKLSSHKQLKGGIKFVDSLPKSETGKILRRKLREIII
ncbi:UNVERIFIED_CONTAM: hypothetical protein RMT77_003706 [Armadillidium vulgare]